MTVVSSIPLYFRLLKLGSAPTTAIKFVNAWSNIGVSSAKGNQSVVEFLSGIEEQRVELDGAEYNATVAFFTSRDYDTQSAQSLAYVLMKQAKADNVDIFTVLDTLKPSDPVQLSQLVTEVLNAYRYKTSVLGYKNDRTAQSHVSRNLKA